mmetsp:Transcript_55108/g.154688  ORF Transcript_55108/g.154688 Transcript_55108/m.154688 type:complete len:238 (-) Transcript_55108:25-738(-)
MRNEGLTAWPPCSRILGPPASANVDNDGSAYRARPQAYWPAHAYWARPQAPASTATSFATWPSTSTAYVWRTGYAAGGAASLGSVTFMGPKSGLGDVTWRDSMLIATKSSNFLCIPGMRVRTRGCSTAKASTPSGSPWIFSLSWLTYFLNFPRLYLPRRTSLSRVQCSRWQKWHDWPLKQPSHVPKKAHGRQLPAPCAAEPTEASGSPKTASSSWLIGGGARPRARALAGRVDRRVR